MRRAGNDGADDLAEQDGDEGARLNQAVAHHQFAFFEVVGQDGVFQRAEQRGLRAHAEQHGQKQYGRLDIKTVGRHAHDDDFQYFDDAGETRFVVTGAELAGDGGKEEIGQDEQQRAEIQHLRGRQDAVFSQAVIADHDEQGGCR